jgi:hypothetical protein
LQFKSLEGLRQEVRHRSWGEPRQPLLLGLEKGAVLVLPWDPRYGKTVENDPGDLKERVLPLGEPFSRLWLNEGIWRPVRIW